MVSNAYQAVTKKCDWLQDAACLDVIKQINSMTNPKIESLTKGDKTYNDPANGAKGTLAPKHHVQKGRRVLWD